MTPTTIARAKVLAKSLRSEAEKLGFHCQLTACQAAIAAGSGAKDWQSLTNHIKSKQTSASWRSNEAAAKLAQLSNIDLALTQSCIRNFEGRITGRHGAPTPAKNKNATSPTILGILRFELIDGKIHVFEKSDDGIWIENDHLDLFISPDGHAYDVKMPFYVGLLQRAFRYPSGLDFDEILAWIKAHTDFLEPSEYNFDINGVANKIAMQITSAMNMLVESAVGTLPGLKNALSGVALFSYSSIRYANAYLNSFEDIKSVPSYYRRFIKLIDDSFYDPGTSTIDYKERIDNAFNEPIDEYDLEMIRSRRCNAPELITGLLDGFAPLTVASEKTDLKSLVKTHRMITSDEEFAARQYDYGVFSMIKQHVAGIKDRGIARGTARWLARYIVWKGDDVLFQLDLNEMISQARVQLTSSGKRSLLGYDVIAVDTRKNDTLKLLNVIFGDLSSIQNERTGTFDGSCFVIDKRGPSIADFAIACIKPNGPTQIAVAEGIAAPQHFQKIADLIGKQFSRVIR